MLVNAYVKTDTASPDNGEPITGHDATSEDLLVGGNRGMVNACYIRVSRGDTGGQNNFLVMLVQNTGHKVETRGVPIRSFTMAEDYHQKYLLKNHDGLEKETVRIYPRHRDLDLGGMS